MRWAIHFGIRSMLTQRKLVLVLALVFGVAAAAYLTLVGLQQALNEIFSANQTEWLVVQEPGSFGEFYGSVLPGEVEEQLKALGVSQVIPVIHAITGTSRKDTRLVQGVVLSAYTQTNTFQMLEGRALQEGDGLRLAMVGWRLAEKAAVEVGGTLALRGRDFEVVGVFRSGTFADNEAWISLESAQQLLGFGESVSIFLAPDEGVVQAGEILAGEGERPPLEVVRQGYSVAGGKQQYQPLLDLFRAVTMALGVGAALTLTHVLLRLAWMRRRELAVLRTVGFPTLTLEAFLLTQALCILALGLIFGFACAALLPLVAKIDMIGVSVAPTYSAAGLLETLGWMLSLVVLGSALPAWWLSRYNLAALLRNE